MADVGVQIPAVAGAPAPLAREPAIELRGLRRDYGDRPVLRDVAFTVPVGTTLFLLGPNGAGKTTLLRILAGLLRPSAGEVSVLGRRLPGETWRLRGRVGFLGHEPLLYSDLSARENLRFHARLHGLGEAGEARAEQLIAAVGMERRGDELVRNLSAGMVQRVAACRAVIHAPELLLLDEPRSHLDPEAAKLVEPLLGPAPQRTRVVVTHDVRAGLPADARLVALGHGGRVVYEGSGDRFGSDEAAATYRGAPR